MFNETKSSSDVVYLPNTSQEDDELVGVDQTLRRIPSVMDTRDELLAEAPVHLDSSSKERVLYVGQGEVAHCTSTQCDVLVSDKATTCHILALRSTSTSSATHPLCSLTHVDGTSYDECIHAMFREHAEYHKDSTELIAVDVHVLGGYEDSQSRKLSNWLLHLLADIADEFEGIFTITLKTVVISSLNDNGCGPIGRGLALDCASGRVYLAKCCTTVTGPEPVLRATRLWSTNDDLCHQPKLCVIHRTGCDYVSIETFRFEPFADLDILLQVPDDVLVQYLSTSPAFEEADFCCSVRETLYFLRDKCCDQIFGQQACLSFERCFESPNTWRRSLKVC